ncbi:hypothetical protein AB0M89_13180 [Streptomyces microflavus]
MQDLPEHCGAPMELYRAHVTDFEVVCRGRDYGFGVDHDGVIRTPPTNAP